MNNLKINSRRRQLAIVVLIEEPVAVKDLGCMIGTFNPEQIISELHHQRFKCIIKTRRSIKLDQDGKKCRPEEYYIPQSSQQIVEKALAQARAKANRAIKKESYSDDIRRK